MRLYLSSSRFYAVAVQRDLFGEPVIVRCWGGRGSRLGGMTTEPFSWPRLHQIHKERRRHGYSLA
ncbi:WGR domain-containing protein [Crenobacter cavernae]|uniref:WGR domain-containing protein n=1 Tax=Crenobacter cavernae TaxID=2290923 RepID=A0ABY0FAQ0_9NEIS|nr:WGR domain-containing protein [Crenobacter cavernae]RXZ42725.1 hypothetical protein EBB06_12605 [Crenobacter cavernae]